MIAFVRRSITTSVVPAVEERAGRTARRPAGRDGRSMDALPRLQARSPHDTAVPDRPARAALTPTCRYRVLVADRSQQACDSADRRRELFVDVAEASVGEDGYDVAGFELRGDGGDDGVGVGVDLGGDGAGAEAGGYVLGMEALGDRDGLGLEDAGKDDLIGEGEGVDEFVLEDVAAEGVGAWLEDGDEAAAAVGGAEGRGGSRGWRWGGGRSRR